MDLNEYIKMSYKRPNRKVLEGLGASEGLIEYLMETPWNTNWNVVDSITSSGSGGDAEVWLVGNEYEDEGNARMFTLSNVGDVDHITELYTNGANYNIYLNGDELPYFHLDEETRFPYAVWTDSNSESQFEKLVDIAGSPSGIHAKAGYVNASTAPTSVEVSVKAK